MAKYIINSPYRSRGLHVTDEISLEKIEPHPDVDVDGKGEVLLNVRPIMDGKQVGPESRVYMRMEDLARLGRIAQAILDGREPATKNYDRKEES